MKRTVLLAAIFLTALALRVALVSHAAWYPRSDTRDYHEFALNLMKGNGYVCTFNENPAYAGFVQRSMRPPGYPLTLAAVYLLTGFQPRHAMYLNVIAEMVTLWLVYLLARRYLRPRFQLVAVALFGLSFTWVPNLMTESVFTCVFLSAIYLMLTGSYAQRWGPRVLLALLIAYAIMLRPIAIVLFVPVGLHVLQHRTWRALLLAVVVGLPTALYLGIWMGRNHALYGRVFLTSNAHLHLAGSYGIDHHQAMAEFRNSRGGAMPNEAEVDAHMKALIDAKKQADPGLAWRVYRKHVRQLFSLAPAWELDGWLWQVTWQQHPALRDLHKNAYGLHYLLYPLGFAGLLALSRRWQAITQVLLAFFLLHPLVSHGNVRFMAPLIPLLCFASALALQLLADFTAPPPEPAAAPAPAPEPTTPPASVRKKRRAR